MVKYAYEQNVNMMIEIHKRASNLKIRHYNILFPGDHGLLQE